MKRITNKYSRSLNNNNHNASFCIIIETSNPWKRKFFIEWLVGLHRYILVQGFSKYYTLLWVCKGPTQWFFASGFCWFVQWWYLVADHEVLVRDKHCVIPRLVRYGSFTIVHFVGCTPTLVSWALLELCKWTCKWGVLCFVKDFCLI